MHKFNKYPLVFLTTPVLADSMMKKSDMEMQKQGEMMMEEKGMEMEKDMGMKRI